MSENQFTKFPLYTGHGEVVGASKITEIRRLKRCVLLPVTPGDGYGAMAVTTSWFEKHSPKVGGYLVKRRDDSLSYFPAESFEAGYSRLE